jgi:nitric oxide dioxygenase
MLSEKSASVVRDTLPAVGAAIGEITPIFYQRMFDAHPELIKNLFNRGNQAQGDQPQALAGSIAAYATMLVSDTHHNTDEILDRVAHKHVSLGVVGDQYPIVHEHLFAAIVQVLGAAVTDEVAAAWDELYWHMADDLIAREAALYASFGVAPGDVWRRMRVKAREQESPDTVSFLFEPVDGSPLPHPKGGQYVSVRVPLPDGANQIRQYSLTEAPKWEAWGISVKATPATTDESGAAIPEGEVSNFLHRNYFEGDEIDVSLPCGDLVVDEGDDPIMLISAGIGCTPVIGILHYLVHTGVDREVTVLHADRSPARQAHRRELSELVSRLPGATLHHWYEDLGIRRSSETTNAGLMKLQKTHVTPNAQAYLCGPLPFMESVRATLVEQGVTAANIHYEVFGPDKWLPKV